MKFQPAVAELSMTVANTPSHQAQPIMAVCATSDTLNLQHYHPHNVDRHERMSEYVSYRQ